MYSVPSQKRQHHEHEQCTFDFCEHSQLDFTLVEQHHEDCEGDGNCSKFQFRLEQLDRRVETESATAWKLVSDESDDAPSLINSEQAYMAVSHVWADGTGAGIWGPGKVNTCLYRFFCDLARSFQCEGCWWDTISIPRTNKLRNKALNTMHDNYAKARVTLVHDLYLRDWEWVDAETACFAIVMSPWYSRGWTALELAKSRKVHILFKAGNGRSSIKDLDVDILDKVPPFSPHYATAEAIRTLRRAKIETLEDLSSILNPRDTSKIRDIPIISGLLVGVDVSGGLSQQDIYQRILRKLGKVAQGHLFHNSAATMAAPGFSWCPTNIFDMPMVEVKSKSEWLDLRENGDLEGSWRVYSTDAVRDSDFVWHGTHALTRVSLKSALGDEMKRHHLLLIENGSQHCTRALLVQPIHCEMLSTNVIYCRLVGPVYFHPGLSSRKNDCNGHIFKIRITNNDKMRRSDLEDNAWDFVHRVFEGHKPSEEFEATSTNSAWDMSPILDDGASGWQDMKALLFLNTNTKELREQLFLDSSKILPMSQSTPSEGLVMYCLHEDSNNSSASIRAFFYGHQVFAEFVKRWLGSSSVEIEETVKTAEMMHLSCDKDWVIQVHSNGLSARDSLLDGEALRVVVENGQRNLAVPLVCLLLENGASYVLKHKVKPDGYQNEMHSVIHLAAYQGYVKIVRAIVRYMKKDDLDERDQYGRTALIVAILEGRCDVVPILLSAGAATDVRDQNQHTALHYAARNGDTDCVEALLNYAKTQCQKETMDVASSSASDEKSNGDIGSKPHGDAEDEGDNDKCKSFGRSGSNQTQSQFAQKANLEVGNNEGKTALQLASQEGNSDVLRLLLKHGASTSVFNSPDQTALALAVKHGNVDAMNILLQGQLSKGQPNKRQSEMWKPSELDAALLSALISPAAGVDEIYLMDIIESLVQHGARPGPTDANGMTALHWAIKLKNQEIAVVLIDQMEQKDRDFERKSNKEQLSALGMAVFYGREIVANKLLEKGADIRSKDSRNRNVLHWAAFREQVGMTELLAARGIKAMINELDTQGHTPLQLAAQSGETATTVLLLHHGADAFRLARDGRCALILAAESRRIAVVKILLAKGCDPMREDKSGKSALGWAAMKGFDSVVHLILEYSNGTLRDQAVEKALRLAVQDGHLEVSIMLHEKIKEPRLRDSLVSTVLFSPAAAAVTSISATEELVKLVRGPNQQDENGQPALMFAVRHKKPLLVDRLLELNADPDRSDRQERTALMLAAQRDDRRSVEALLDAKANTDIQDIQGYTALHYAAEFGHLSLMHLLLELRQALNVNIQDWRKRTALHIILEKVRTNSSDGIDPSLDYERRLLNRVLRSLLMSGARLDIQDVEKQTPLHWAVRRNRIDIVELLLDPTHNTARLDIPDGEGRTPLILAAERRYSRIVRLLLRNHPFDLNSQDVKGRTPLLLAAAGGDKSSVTFLLERNANPDLADKKSRTALMKAAQNGHRFIVGLLTDMEKRDTKRHRHEHAYIDARDDTGRTALMLAAESGYSQIVKDLQRKGANSNLIDDEGKRAWQRAMNKGHADTVDSLLSAPDVPSQDMMAVNEALLVASRRGWTELVEVLLRQRADVTFQHLEGTALHMAAMGGHFQVMQRLLEKGIDILAYDKKKRTALMLATEHGFESIVKLLLARPEVKDGINDWMGPEALRCAAEKDNRGMVNLFLEVHIDPNGRDSTGRTALTLATVNGNQEVVDLLLQGQANPNSKDDQNMTALHHAAWGGPTAEKGFESVVETLLEEEENVRDALISQQKALIFASQEGYAAVAEALLKKGAELRVTDEDGLTPPLHWAAKRGDHVMVKLLIKRGGPKMTLDAMDKHQQTPLCLAIQEGRATVARVLLSNEADPNIIVQEGRTVLHIAAKDNNIEIAEMLVNYKADPHVRDNQKQKAWLLAAKAGHYHIARLLLAREVDFNPRSQKIKDLFLDMAADGFVPMVDLLLQHGVNIDVADRLGRSAIAMAVKHEKGDVVKLLLKDGADPGTRDSNLQTPLLWAAKTGNRRIMNMLLGTIIDKNTISHKEIKKSLNHSDSKGRTALLIALKNKHDEVAKLLLDEGLKGGIDLNLRDTTEKTALHYAAETGNDELLRLLLDQSAEPTVQDALGRTPLFLAVDCDRETAVEVLLESRDHALRIPDFRNQTVFHLVAERGNIKMARMLLDHNADQNRRDDQGRTPLSLSVENGHKEIIDLLLEKEAKQELPDCDQRTALSLAVVNGDKSIVEALLGHPMANVEAINKQGRTLLQLAVQSGNMEVTWLVARHMTQIHGPRREHEIRMFSQDIPEFSDGEIR